MRTNLQERPETCFWLFPEERTVKKKNPQSNLTLFCTGANYFDNTSLKEKEDDMVRPNGEHVYYWEVTPEVSPLPDDPTCLTHTYISHQNVVQDYNSGLIGTLLICKPG